MNFPDNIPIASVRFWAQNHVAVNRSRGGVREASATLGHLYGFTVTTGELNFVDSRDVDGFADSLEGTLNPFSIVLPIVSYPMGTPLINGTPYVTSASARQLVTANWRANITSLFRRGDVIKMSGHSKVYKIAANVNSDASGNAIIPLTRPLLKPVNAGETIIFTAVPFRVALQTDAQKFELNERRTAYFEFDCLEDVL